MKLTEPFISKYLTYLFPDKVGEEHLNLVEKWKSQAADGSRQLENFFVKLSPEEEISASVYVSHFHESTYAIQLPTSVINDPSVQFNDVESLIVEAINRLKELKATRGDFRLTEKAHLLPLSNRLPHLGFQQSHTRIEFQLPMDKLPDESGTPFEWRSVSEQEPFTLSAAAKILEKAGDGDPDWNSQDDNSGLLQSYLDDSEFKSNLDCIQIGLIKGQPAAIVIAQVIPESGWSRITYMGLLPAFRNQGLGKWVHRHGFQMMRSQGGKLYHGGTVRGNVPMEKLFRNHGCEEFRTMQEWIIAF